MYKFELRERGAGYLNVRPIYGEDSKLNVEREQGEMFCRYELDGNLTFTGEDYDFFVREGVAGDYEINLFWVNDKDTTQRNLIMNVPFDLTDMKFDEDNKIATLSLKGKDQYEEFLNKYDSEYDLVKLAPRKESVLMYKSAFLQLYVFGDTKLTHILGNFEYEVDASADAINKTYDQIKDMGFTELKKYNSIDIITEPSWGISRYDGRYFGDRSTNELLREDRLYKAVPDSEGLWKIVPMSGSDPEIKGLAFPFVWNKPYHEGNLEYRPLSGLYKYGGKSKISTRDIYGRIILDKKIEGSLDISSTDVWEKNLNYRYAKKFDDMEIYTYKNKVVLSEKLTTTPNEYLSNGEGKYFVKPNPIKSVERVIAIGWNQWIPMSIWFRNDVYISENLSQYDVTWSLDDAYPLRDCIERLLSKVAPWVGLKSNFIDNGGLGGLSNPILGDGKRLWLFLTPVTNIKKTYYNQASQKGGITLKQILDMMRICFNCYWCLKQENGQWFLRIEHISWFENGGDYLYQRQYKDLTEDIVNLSNKPWITEQNKYHFDMGDIYSRKEFSWGDKASEIFNGYPYEAKENIANKKPIVKEQVANFVSEVDLIVSSPDSVSDDMFVVLGADDELEKYKIYREKIGHYNDSGYITDQYPQYIPQNSMLPFYFTEQKFLNYNMPGLRNDSIEMDGEGSSYVPSKSKAKLIRQTVHVPFEIEKPDLAEEKFSTGLDVTYGMGRIERIEANLSTQDAEIELTFNYKQ